MDADLQPVYTQVMDAAQPEDLFGSEDVVLPVSTLLGYLAEKYDALKSKTNPMVYRGSPEDVAAATEADTKLEQQYALAQARIRNHVYGINGRGRPRPAYATKSFTVGPNTYYLGRKLWEGSRTQFYEAFMVSDGHIVGEVMVKIACDASQNDFVQSEVRNLDILHGEDVPQWKHLPFLMDKFQAGGRAGMVQRKISGFSLKQVREHRLHRNGLEQRHMVWILDRILSCLGYVHHRGMVKGDLDPERVIVQPLSHNCYIVGWGVAAWQPAITGERISGPFTDFTAPEVRESGEIGPWSDVFSVGKLMIWLVGGDPVTNEIPMSVAEPFRHYLLRMVQENRSLRPSNCWDLHQEESDIKDKLWKRKFLHLDMS